MFHEGADTTFSIDYQELIIKQSDNLNQIQLPCRATTLQFESSIRYKGLTKTGSQKTPETHVYL